MSRRRRRTKERLSKTPVAFGLDGVAFANYFEADRRTKDHALARAFKESERPVFVGFALTGAEVDEHLTGRLRDAGVEAVSSVLARRQKRGRAKRGRRGRRASR